MEIESGEGRPFICGVVEGFYNRPWSQDQRVDLYKKLKTYGLNAYLYAPKDDVKHRALWRELYNEPELRQLKILIDGCQENDVSFYYGISPGLDMTYSNPEDMQRLKAKLDQLQTIGCKAFAVLWDDIDTQLPVNDRKGFNSLADAHVKVCNEIYEHLKQPQFLTCPVEYCASRADPSVAGSHYLNTMGMGLHPNIGIFWTGSRVVSEFITKQEVLALTDVLRRKPLIWDNLHANDYDQARVFLGPYIGRSPEIIPYLTGVFTNPNCEYSLNVPALFTLAAWSHCYDPRSGLVGNWDPFAASNMAITHFLEECRRPTMVSSEQVGANQSSITAASKVLGAAHSTLDKEDIELLFHFFWLPYSNGPKAVSMIDSFKELRDHAHIIQKFGLYKPKVHQNYSSPAPAGALGPPPGIPDSLTATDGAPSTADDEMSDQELDDQSSTGNTATDVDMTNNTTPVSKDEEEGSNVLSSEEAIHDREAELDDLYASDGGCDSRSERHLISSWLRKASNFNEVCKRFSRMIDKMTFIENREMFFHINGYLSNVNVILQSCNRFLKWVGLERCHKPISGGPTLSGLPGGVAGDLMRLYPVRSNDEYPLTGADKSFDSDTMFICRLLPRKDWNNLAPAIGSLICQGYNLPETDIPVDVIRMLHNFKVGVFLGETDSRPVVVETGTNEIVACIVGSRNVSNLMKSLQQVCDLASKSVDLSQLPITIPDSDELPWHLLGNYDVLVSFVANPRLLFTKLLEEAFRTFYDMMVSNSEQGLGNSAGGAGAPAAAASGTGSNSIQGISPHSVDASLIMVPCKFGIMIERASSLSIQFLCDMNFRRVGTYGHFVILENDMVSPP